MRWRLTKVAPLYQLCVEVVRQRLQGGRAVDLALGESPVLDVAAAAAGGLSREILSRDVRRGPDRRRDPPIAPVPGH